MHIRVEGAHFVINFRSHNPDNCTADSFPQFRYRDIFLNIRCFPFAQYLVNLIPDVFARAKLSLWFMYFINMRVRDWFNN